ATAIRKLVSAELNKAVATSSFDNLVKDVITGKVQMKIRDKAKKVYPVQILEIRKILLLSSAKEMGVEEAPAEIAPLEPEDANQATG
ncbi:MAG: hypothetical protein ABIF10_06055, partial [Candidatus Woesearchaeota archaeon]